MKNIFVFAILIVVITASSCATGKLTKRYNTITLCNNHDTIKKYIEVSAYVIDKDKVEPQKPKTIFDLSPQAQAALIEEIGKKETGTDKFLANLVNTLSLNTISSEDIIDYSQFEKRIVVSVRNKSRMPADRIPKITISFEIDSTAKLLGCSKLTTEYQSIDLGKTNYTNSLNAEVSANALSEAGITDVKTNEKDSNTKSAKTNVGLSGKLSASRSFSEEVLLKQRIVVLNASISQNTLKMYQEGISGIDLSGNILADITFVVKDLGAKKVYSFSNLKKDSVLNDPQNVKVIEKVIIYPNLINDVKAKIGYEADFRQVTKKHKTISESDDDVILYYGEATSPKAEVLITLDKLLPKLYYLTVDSSKMPVRISNPFVVGSVELLFNSFNEASDFVFWLKSKFDNSNKVLGDNKIGIEIGKQEFIVIMPKGFSTIQNIEIQPRI